MKATNYSQIPFVGRLQKHALAKLSFEVVNPLGEVTKGKVRVESSIETGVAEPTHDGYFAAVTIAAIGHPSENADEITFRAECKIIGFYSITEKTKLNAETLTKAAQIRGALQIYPMVRRQLLAMLSVDGPRFSIPVEPDFAFVDKASRVVESSKSSAISDGKKTKRRSAKK